jgi:hypothetical protein
MNKADKLKGAMKHKPATVPAPKPSAEAVEKFASGGKANGGDNAKVTLHFTHEADKRLRQYFAGLQSPRGTLSGLVEGMVLEGLDKRGG